MNPSAAQIKHLRSLKLKKFREKYGQFLIEGDKIVREALAEQAHRIISIYALPEWIAHLPERAKQKNAAILHDISEKTLERISLLRSPNKAVALMKMPPPTPLHLPKGSWSIYLDGLRDPGNVGTIWRIADWFGFRQILASPDTVDFYNPKVIQASMGAFLRIPATTTAPEKLKQLKPPEKFAFWGADMNGLPFGKWNPPPHGVLVIGSEAEGISPKMRALLENTLCIPKAPHSRAESLNAAVAAAILAAKIAPH